jgi:hypothetical protein
VTNVSYQLDWISWVGRFPDTIGQGDQQQVLDRIFDHAAYHLGEALAEGLFDNLKPMSKGRAPYKYSWVDKDKGITIYGSPSQPHYTVEHSGKGCDFLERHDALDSLLHVVGDWATRVDVAVDIETDLHPFAFALAREAGRFKSYSELQSPSGATSYVGSMSSERYARVYRYSPPHPRAHLLRAEHVFRKDAARKVIAAYLYEGIASVVAGCWRDFGWYMELPLEEDVAPADLSPFRPERNQGKTLRWLITVVAPSFKKLCAEGVVPDPVEFLREYFLPNDYPNDPHQLTFGD